MKPTEAALAASDVVASIDSRMSPLSAFAICLGATACAVLLRQHQAARAGAGVVAAVAGPVLLVKIVAHGRPAASWLLSAIAAAVAGHCLCPEWRTGNRIAKQIAFSVPVAPLNDLWLWDLSPLTLCQQRESRA